MQILVFEADGQAKATVMARLKEVLREGDIRGIAVASGDPAALSATNWPSTCGVIVGGATPDELVTSIKKIFKGPCAIALTPERYTQEAVALVKRLDVQVFTHEDTVQLGSFVVEADKHFKHVRSLKNKNIIGVCQLKGGVGCTTVATALAGCFARHGIVSTLVDLDDVNPHITAWARVPTAKRAAVGEYLNLGSVPEAHVDTLLTAVENFDECLTVVGQPEPYHEAFHFKANVLETAPSASAFINSLLSVVHGASSMVVLDLAKSWGLATFAALPRCERILLVIDDDPQSIQRSLDVLRRLKRESDDTDEFDLSRWSIVFNRSTGENRALLDEALAQSELFAESVTVTELPLCAAAQNWAQPGYTFYDYADDNTRAVLETLASEFAELGELPPNEEEASGFTATLKRLLPF